MLAVDPSSYGLNLFAYCGNDPVNRVDPNGDYSWKQLKNDAKAVFCEIGNAIVDTADAFFSSLSFGFECGLGFGGSVNIGNAVEIEALAVFNRDALEVDKDGFRDYREMEFSASATAIDTATFGPYIEYRVDLSEVHESNSFYTNPNGKWDTSWAPEIGNVEFGDDRVISFGTKGYFIFGFGIEFGFNIDNFFEKIGDIGR